MRTTRKVVPLSIRGQQTPTWRRGAVFASVAVGGILIGLLGARWAGHWSDGRGAGEVKLGIDGMRALSQVDSLKDRLVEIDQALKRKDFGVALLLTEEALRYFPGDVQLMTRRTRTDDELHNRFRYQVFEQAILKRNYAAALAVFAEIPLDSAYKFRATQELPVARSHYVAEQLAAAQSALRLGNCEEARLYAGRVQTLEPTQAGLQAILSQCEHADGAKPE